MNILFWRKLELLTLPELIMASMGMGYIIKRRGRDTYVFLFLGRGECRECVFHLCELNNPIQYKGILEVLASEATREVLPGWHSALALTKDTWK
jgi:hypothetical protein